MRQVPDSKLPMAAPARRPLCSVLKTREIVHREETATLAWRRHRSGQKIVAMACHAEQSEANALSDRMGPSRAAGSWVLLAAGPRRPLLVSQTGGTGTRTWGRQAAGGNPNA